MRRVDQCQECGFTYVLDDADVSASAIVDGASELATLLVLRSEVRRRRDPHVWSPLEYGCHVRDVLLVQRERVLEARRTDGPSFSPMGRDERVEHDGYATQDPRDVARQLTDAAQLFGNVLSRLHGDEWERTVHYNYPAAAERTLRWVAVHSLHEVRHHLLDVQRQVL